MLMYYDNRQKNVTEIVHSIPNTKPFRICTLNILIWCRRRKKKKESTHFWAYHHLIANCSNFQFSFLIQLYLLKTALIEQMNRSIWNFLHFHAKSVAFQHVDNIDERKWSSISCWTAFDENQYKRPMNRITLTRSMWTHATYTHALV